MFTVFLLFSYSAVFMCPVFTSKFKILSDGERLEGTQTSKEDEKRDTTATERKAGEEAGGVVVPCLDEDGDLDIARRCGKTLLYTTEEQNLRL